MKIISNVFLFYLYLSSWFSLITSKDWAPLFGIESINSPTFGGFIVGRETEGLTSGFEGNFWTVCLGTAPLFGKVGGTFPVT